MPRQPSPFLLDRRRLMPPMALLVALAVLLVPTAALVGTADASGRPGEELRIRVLSNRADLISGGDAYVRILLPRSADLTELAVDVDGRDVTGAFARRDDGRVTGLVTGLQPGENVLRARLPGRSGAQITITDHDRGGPVLAGPQIQPWICTTAANGLGPPRDAKCNGATVYEFYYKDALTQRFERYDRNDPPPKERVATTTTDHDRTVPYIVRVETGTLDRGIYSIAVLSNPHRRWRPWAPQRGWNGKLSFKFGAACNPGHSQAEAEDPLDDMMLRQGFAVAVSSMNVFGNACNLHTSAESLMMIKERIRERYGAIRYTIGNGCSGGAEQQYSIAANYPGLLDGLLPQCTFADAWTPAIFDKFDCALLDRYFTRTSPHLWASPAARAAVLGGPLGSAVCAEAGAFAPAVWDPSTGCALPEHQMYHPQRNRDGARCTLPDYNVAALGRDPDTGFANTVTDHVGVQWGLAALQAGDITPEQFVDLNEKIGGFDADFGWQPQRSRADLPGVRRMYRTGQLSHGRNLARVPVIDVRTDDTYDFHSNVQPQIVRARLVDAVGHHDSQAYWFETHPGAFGMATPAMAERAFNTLDRWLTAIENDRSDVPLPAKVVRNKPAAATDGCFAAGVRIDEDTACAAAQTDNVLPRHVAGMPLTSDVLKCRLRPLDRLEYRRFNVVFTDSQWGRLQPVFPNGVCDYSRPGVGQQPPVAGAGWLTLASGPGGQPLGPPPQSQPLRGNKQAREPQSPSS
jgi:hypothetical protein